MLAFRNVSVDECASKLAPCLEQKCLLTYNSHCRFCKPLDGALVRRLAREHPVLITIEEGAIGGFGSHGARF